MGKRKQKASTEVKQKSIIKNGSLDGPNVINDLFLE